MIIMADCSFRLPVSSSSRLPVTQSPRLPVTHIAYLCAFIDKINLQLTTYNEQQKFFPLLNYSTYQLLNFSFSFVFVDNKIKKIITFVIKKNK